MGKYLGVILLVIAITLTGQISAKPEGAPPETPNNPDTPPPQTCSVKLPAYKKASEEFQSAIEEVFTNALESKTQNIKDALKAKSDAYVLAAEACTNNSTLRNTWNFTVFIDFVEFAVKNTTTLKELKEKDQLTCVTGQKEELENCLKENMFKDTKKKYSGLYDLSQIKFNDLTCSNSKSIKECTLKTLTEKCKDTVNYVTSLFDHMKEYCKKKDEAKSGSGSLRMTAFWVGFVLFIVDFTKRATM